MWPLIRNLSIAVFGVTVVVVVVRDTTSLFASFGGGAAPPESNATKTSKEMVRAGAMPASAPGGGGDRQLVISSGLGGQFFVVADVDGERIQFLVDTGATTVALSRNDARRLGLDDSTLDYTGLAQTANGAVRIAPVNLDEVSIGQLSLRDVRAAVVDHAMPISLLGMSFLSRLNGYEVREDRLIFRW